MKFVEKIVKHWYDQDLIYRSAVSTSLFGVLLFTGIKLFEYIFFRGQDITYTYFHSAMELLACIGIFAIIYGVRNIRASRKRDTDSEAKWLLRFDKLTEKLYGYERTFQQIIDHTPVGVLMFTLCKDGNLIFTGSNPAADAILGVKNQNVLGKTIEEAFPGMEGSELAVGYKRVASGESPAYYADNVEYQDDRINGVFEVCAFPTGPAQMSVFFSRVRSKRLGDYLKEEGVDSNAVDRAIKKQKSETDCYCTIIPLNNSV